MMAGRRTANGLARKLQTLDRRLDAAFLAGDDGLAEDLVEERKRLIVEAKGKGLRLALIPVADGWALYFEARRTTRLAKFEWLYGTEGYVCEFGREVWVPLEMADGLVRGFDVGGFY